jgi:hypothetical protein
MRDFLSRQLFSPLQGMTDGAWRSLLRQNRFAIDPPYWPRAAFQSAISVHNSAFARLEDATYGPRVAAAHIEPPIFILGHWRHGTTHLHNLLALDPNLVAPTLYQTLYPGTFLMTERVVPRLGQPLLLRRRPHDDVALDFGAPNEDELALVNDGAPSPYLSWVFPRRADHYDCFLTFREATGDEVAAWKSSLLGFLKKLAHRDDRPPVLKSPPHTARIGVLLDLFPAARFVHIRRNPYQVFRSARHMYATTMRYWRLQSPPPGDEDDRILRIYREMYDTYFDQRGLIPTGHSCEVTYEDLERDPIGQVGAIYEALGLPGFGAVRPGMEVYLKSIAGYRKNVHSELPEPDRQRVSRG